MAECMAYGKLATHQTQSESQTFPGGVIEGQQKMEGENEAVEEIYEPVPNQTVHDQLCSCVSVHLTQNYCACMQNCTSNNYNLA